MNSYLSRLVQTAPVVCFALLIASSLLEAEAATTTTVQVRTGVAIEVPNDRAEDASISNQEKAALIQEIRRCKEVGLPTEDLWNKLHPYLDRDTSDSNLDEGTDACPGADLGSVLGTNVASGNTNHFARTWGAFPSRPTCWQGVWYVESGNAFDVAYKWVAPFTGYFSFSLCGSNYDTGISLWNNTCSDHQPVYPRDFICGNDDDPRTGGCGSSFQSYLECIQLDAGHEILIVVDGFDNASGLYTLGISECQNLCLNPQYCGTPVESEPNGLCETANLQMTCGDASTYFGVICAPENDADYVRVSVAPMTVSVLRIYDSENCLVNPANNVVIRAYNLACQTLSSSTRDYIRMINSGAEYYDFLIRIGRRLSSSVSSPYRLVIECCQISTCETATEIPSGEWNGSAYLYETAFSTCCGLNSDRIVYQNGCSGVTSPRGPEVFHKLVLMTNTTVSFSLSGAGDNQLSILTDCLNPVVSCVASSDHGVPLIGGTELIENMYLSSGTYYIVSSLRGTTVNDCGMVRLIVSGDQQLAVELASFDAVAGDGAVTVYWQTASESNLEYFELLRDDLLIKRINASNRSTGAAYTWVDNGLENGRLYRYGLMSVSSDGSQTNLGNESASPNASEGTVTSWNLMQNQPNPFNAMTNIAFDVREDSDVELSVFNLAGQKVATLVEGRVEAGRHTVQFDGANLASSVYLYRVQAGSFVAQKKMVLLK